MATKRFPDSNDTPMKTTLLHDYDALLLADSEANFQAKMTTIEKLIEKVNLAIDVSQKADKIDVLTIATPNSTLDPNLFPADDWHPAPKWYVDERAEIDDVLTISAPNIGFVPSDQWHPVNKKYHDDQMSTHVADFHALSGTHAADVVALSGAIDTNTASIDGHVTNVSNPHGVTQSQVGLDQVDNTSDLDKPISTATQAYIDSQLGGVTQGIVNGNYVPNVYNYNYFNLEIQGDSNIGNPITETVGKTGTIVCKMDGTGGHNLTFSSEWKFPAGDPTSNINTDPNAWNVFRYTVLAENVILTEFVADFV